MSQWSAAVPTGRYASRAEARMAAHLDLLKAAGEIDGWRYVGDGAGLVQLAGGGRMSFVLVNANARCLSIRLPGVVTWRRPRMSKGRMRYPEQYAQERFAWAMQVKARVRETQWDASSIQRYAVDAYVFGKGRYDLDRVLTAVLDALQAGGAMTEDCKADYLRAWRGKPAKGREAHVLVDVREAD